MSFAPFKVKRTLRHALRRTRDDDGWSEEIGLAVLEAAVLCAPVIVAGSFELYIAREKARAKIEVERLRALHANKDGEE